MGLYWTRDWTVKSDNMRNLHGRSSPAGVSGAAVSSGPCGVWGWSPAIHTDNPTTQRQKVRHVLRGKRLKIVTGRVERRCRKGVRGNICQCRQFIHIKCKRSFADGKAAITGHKLWPCRSSETVELHGGRCCKAHNGEYNRMQQDATMSRRISTWVIFHGGR